MTQMNGHQAGDESLVLSSKQARLIELLIGGSKIVDAAKELAINESTCRRWLKLSHVATAYEAAKDDLFHTVLVGLQRQSLAALQKHILASPDVTAGSQMRAVSIVLDHMLMREKMSELETKLDELSALLEKATY